MDFLDKLPLAPEQVPVVAFVAIFLAIFLVGWALISIGRRNPSTDRRLVFGFLTTPLARIIPQTRRGSERVAQELRRAGRFHPKAKDEFLAVRNVLTLGCLAMTWMWMMAAAEPNSPLLIPILVIGGVATLLAYSLPILILEWKAARRVERIQYGLPDALDIVTMALSGGASLQRALQSVGREIRPIHPDLAQEFDIIYTQTETGSLGQALNQFSNRIDVPDVRSLTTLVGQTHTLGANVAPALRDFGDSIRRAHRQRAEERGNKTSVKLLFPIALCLTPPVYILLLAPAVLEIKDFVERENRPGGVLEQRTPDTLNRGLRSQAPPAPTPLTGAAS